jgi:iron complex outermembrane receptor protein
LQPISVQYEIDLIFIFFYILPAKSGEKNMSNSTFWAISGLGILAGAVTVPAAADTSASAAALTEVVVTARKVKENVVNVPISMATLSARQLSALNANELSSLGNSIPNVTVGTSDEARHQNIVIRGISTVTRSIGEETGVATYVDGVYTGRIETYNQDLADVDQVEVLRGPQGTLFGRNTTEGAILINTVQPGSQATGSAMLEFGNYGLLQTDGYVSGPIEQGLLYGKVSWFGATDNGYATNLYNGAKAGNRNDGGGRIELRATPTENLDITLSVDAMRHHDNPYLMQITSGAFGQTLRPFTFDDYYPPKERTSNGGASLTIKDQLPGGQTLTSISSWRESGWTQFNDETYNGQDLAFSNYTEHTDYASQELRINSPASARLAYVAGLYYSYQYSTTHTPVSIGDGLATIFGIPDGLESFDERADVRTSAYAGYANLSYHLSSSWTLTAGGRYTWETEHLDLTQVDPDGLGFVPDIGPLTRGYTNGAFTPTASIVYGLAKDWNIYATYSSGYKSGGFNVDTLSTAAHIGFGPEHVKNYEIGTKGEFLDARLRTNFDLFYEDYDDLQVTQYDPKSFSNYIGNAASARIDGIEFDATALIAPRWIVSASIGVLDTKFNKFIDQYGNDLVGERLTFAPKFSGALQSQYTVPLNAGVSAYVNGEFDYRSAAYSQYNDIKTTPSDLLPAYGLLNGAVGLSFDDSRLKIELFAHNLTNKLYQVNKTTQLPLLSFLPPYAYEETTTTYGMPRTYGVALKLAF